MTMIPRASQSFFFRWVPFFLLTVMPNLCFCPISAEDDRCAADNAAFSSADSAPFENASSAPNLYEDIDSMLAVSYLIQDIALFNHWDKVVGVGQLHNAKFFSILPRTTSEIGDWFNQNFDLLKSATWQTLSNFDPDFDLQALEAIVARDRCGGSQEQGTLEVLNDEFAFHGRESKVVYGIARNPARKRLTVAFRGSINMRDWEQDFKAHEQEVNLTPESLRDNIPNPDGELIGEFENVTVHYGFFEYLFEKQTGDQSTKFVEVINEVLSRLKDQRYKGYSLYFTGHSLGGALATLAATASALSKDIPTTVNLITFASPHVGKLKFVEGFRELEVAGKIRHLRITNDDDAVPQGLGALGYLHTGVHLNLRDVNWLDINRKRYSLVRTIEKDDGFWAQTKKLKVSYKWFLGNPTHKLQEHRRRLDKAKKNIEIFSLDDIFENYQ